MSKRFVGRKSNLLSDILGIPIGVGQKTPTAGAVSTLSAQKHSLSFKTPRAKSEC